MSETGLNQRTQSLGCVVLQYVTCFSIGTTHHGGDDGLLHTDNAEQMLLHAAHNARRRGPSMGLGLADAGPSLSPQLLTPVPAGAPPSQQLRSRPHSLILGLYAA